MGQTSEITSFLNVHRDQLISSGVPEHYWQTLYNKLVHQLFDASNCFELLKVERDETEEHEHQPAFILSATKDIKKSDTQHIYLIDHAWTFKIQDSKKQLMENDGLRERICRMLDVDCNLERNELVDELFKKIWKINNFYSISNADEVENRLPIWYVMDEVGTAVIHSDSPNCRVIPFVYINDQITYSLLFPLEDINEGDVIFRDFAGGVNDPIRRDVVLLPWVYKSLESMSVDPPIPGEEYFLTGHVKESLPDLSKLELNYKHKPDILKVFSQYDLVNAHLTYNKFVIVDDPADADILWYTQHFKDFQKLSETPGKFINQFPFEYVLTVKDLLCVTCRRSQNSLRWLPISYNLVTESGHFASCFQRREKNGSDNYWIVKPYNLARSLDIHITNNLDYILRVSLTGPKIAQKYITNPVVFHRPECGGKVKFDIRYVLLLESTKPLKAYVYKNFFLRFANKPFELNDFQDYEKHFTVMNYTDSANLKHMKCSDFLLNWMVQYPDFDWKTIEKSIFEMLKNILESATMAEPPCGLAHNPQSRAVYAADIMLKWTEDGEIEPNILEINFTPDCQRACDYYPEFYNDIFKLLFLNENVDTMVLL
ncbi:unnamed protein product [Phyllotreta striolata]|uniref:Tubulin--tyrosine ligase-like protein 12 SET-like domain-containing protein n=1 Tax=Phyllotreta striolata TaxID=444603 RepID=A0A9N9TQM2_PHYSR|nr:unnamed protein product [Phyllotreta striolata]